MSIDTIMKTFYENILEYICKTYERMVMFSEFKDNLNENFTEYFDYPIEDDDDLKSKILYIFGKAEYEEIVIHNLARMSEYFLNIESRECILTIFMTYHLHCSDLNKYRRIIPELKRLFYLTRSYNKPKKFDVTKIVGIGDFFGKCIMFSEFRFICTLFLDPEYDYANRISTYDISRFCRYIVDALYVLNKTKQKIVPDKEKITFYRFLMEFIKTQGYMRYKNYIRTRKIEPDDNEYIVPFSMINVSPHTRNLRYMDNYHVNTVFKGTQERFLLVYHIRIYNTISYNRYMVSSTYDDMFSGQIIVPLQKTSSLEYYYDEFSRFESKIRRCFINYLSFEPASFMCIVLFLSDGLIKPKLFHSSNSSEYISSYFEKMNRIIKFAHIVSELPFELQLRISNRLARESDLDCTILPHDIERIARFMFNDLGFYDEFS